MKYAIYTTFNENFLETGATMIYSFLQTNKWYNGDIIVLCDEGENCPFSEDSMKKLKKISEKISFLIVDSKEYTEVFDNFSSCREKHFKSSFYKLELFKKDDYDVKMYIDADVCFCSDVKELFEVYKTEHKSFLCRDIISKNCNSEVVEKKTINDYANLGFMLLNCKKITDNEFNEVLSYCKNIKVDDFKNSGSWRGRLGEQDFLNEYLNDAIMLPASIYDCNPRFYDENTKIIHYYGKGRKPWDCIEREEAFNEFYRNYFFVSKIL